MTDTNVYLDFMERYSTDRVGFVREVLGEEPDDWQREILEALDRGERRISVRSGHGVGKSALAGWISTHALSTQPMAKIIQTAPSGPQLWDALFAETKLWFNRLPEALRGLFKLLEDRIESIAAPEQLFVSARTSRAETPEALQGVHAHGGLVYLICDEASGIPEAVYEAGAGSMAGENCATILFSNPTRITGFFFETHHRLADSWFTRHVSCLDCKRIPPDYIEDMKQRYGEDSNAYRVRVLGEFPIADDDCYIKLMLVEAAMGRDIALDPAGDRVWGLDVSRMGKDRCVLTKRQGKVVNDPPRWWRGLDTMQTVGVVVHEWNNTPVAERPKAICVDVIGIGAGVVDRLRELGLPVLGINVAEAPAFDPNGSYSALRDELWAKGRAWLEARDCRLPEDDGLRELAHPRYTFTSSGKLKIESKDSMRKRGLRSPDYADSFLLTLAEAAASASARGYSSNWSKPLKRGIKGVV